MPRSALLLSFSLTAAAIGDGACCFPNGYCSANQSPGSCGYLGGVFRGEGTVCSDCGLMGACCLPVTGVIYCKNTSQWYCTDYGGVFHGVGTQCAPSDCPNPTGACCTGAGCQVLTAPMCGLQSGVYKGNNSTCQSSCPGGVACYANCDGSTTQPVLTVQDCICFINRFTAGDTRANCDGSTSPPILNIMDFSCFVSHLAAGC